MDWCTRRKAIGAVCVKYVVEQVEVEMLPYRLLVNHLIAFCVTYFRYYFKGYFGIVKLRFSC